MGRNASMQTSFLERVRADEEKRRMNKYVNELKNEANQAGKKFGKCREFPDPRGKGYERKNKRGMSEKNKRGMLEEQKKPHFLPTLVTHHQHKYREKNPNPDQQWGPLGW